LTRNRVYLRLSAVALFFFCGTSGAAGLGALPDIPTPYLPSTSDVTRGDAQNGRRDDIDTFRGITEAVDE
jgi:hypothetical protein